MTLAFGQNLESVADHRRARDFAERADVRQARGTIARFEENGLVFAIRKPLEALDEATRLFERPSLGTRCWQWLAQV